MLLIVTEGTKTGRVALRHDPALLILQPEPVCPTRHRTPSFDSVHQAMVETIVLWNSSENCGFGQTCHKGGQPSTVSGQHRIPGVLKCRSPIQAECMPSASVPIASTLMLAS